MNTEKVLTGDALTALQDLAAGYSIRYSEDGHSNYAELVLPSKSISGVAINELLNAGFLKSIPNGSGFWISDEGRKAYLKSTDELGDGKVYIPDPTTTPR